MAIIGKVERKNWKVILLSVVIHLILLLGAATMVYPLLLMLSGSVKSAVDFKDFTLFPDYLLTEKDGQKLLFKKYLATKYNNQVLRMASDFKDPEITFDTVTPPDRKNQVRRTSDYRNFLAECKRELPHYYFQIGMAYEPGIDPLSVRKYREFLLNGRKDSRRALRELNEKYDTQFAAWNEIALPTENVFLRRSSHDYSTGLLKTVHDFKYSSYITPLTEIWPDMEGDFIAMLRRDCGRKLILINQALGTTYNSWCEVILPEKVPEDNPLLAEKWEEFVKNEINADFITVTPRLAAAPWQRFLKEKYGDLATLNKAHSTAYTNWKEIPFSNRVPRSGVVRTDWLDFVKGNSIPRKMWHDFLKEKYQNQIDSLNADWHTAFRTFGEIPFHESHGEIEGANRAAAELEELIRTNREKEVPAEAITLHTLANRYREWLKYHYSNSLGAVANAYGLGYNTFDEIPLRETAPGEFNLAENADWMAFIQTLPPEKIALHRNAAGSYREYLKGLYTRDGVCDFAAMSRDYGKTIPDENSIPVFLTCPDSGKMRADFIQAIQNDLFPGQYLLTDSDEYNAGWHEFLAEKYVVIHELNKKWHITPRDFNDFSLPTREHEWQLLQENAAFLRNEYLTRNYTMVFDTLFTNGKAAVNTLIYCLLAVLAALLINPLCAYGLSRYKPASSYKILLFLMLPMAFPAMVLGIPQFLLIRDLGLLNTFAALILPGIANGYSIFLLKGFFDSLPKELYESAAIDGASEWTVFWQIGMRLSKPILAVIALGAFTAAYGNFMMAFLLCQDKDMWTMMVYLYQLQQTASPAVGFAALAVAAIPTLIVFIFCQNIIIKGIVVPTEK